MRATAHTFFFFFFANHQHKKKIKTVFKKKKSLRARGGGKERELFLFFGTNKKQKKMTSLVGLFQDETFRYPSRDHNVVNVQGIARAPCIASEASSSSTSQQPLVPGIPEAVVHPLGLQTHPTKIPVWDSLAVRPGCSVFADSLFGVTVPNNLQVGGLSFSEETATAMVHITNTATTTSTSTKLRLALGTNLIAIEKEEETAAARLFSVHSTHTSIHSPVFCSDIVHVRTLAGLRQQGEEEEEIEASPLFSAPLSCNGLRIQNVVDAVLATDTHTKTILAASDGLVEAGAPARWLALGTSLDVAESGLLVSTRRAEAPALGVERIYRMRDEHSVHGTSATALPAHPHTRPHLTQTEHLELCTPTTASSSSSTSSEVIGGTMHVQPAARGPTIAWGGGSGDGGDGSLSPLHPPISLTLPTTATSAFEVRARVDGAATHAASTRLLCRIGQDATTITNAHVTNLSVARIRPLISGSGDAPFADALEVTTTTAKTNRTTSHNHVCLRAVNNTEEEGSGEQQDVPAPLALQYALHIHSHLPWIEAWETNKMDADADKGLLLSARTSFHTHTNIPDTTSSVLAHAPCSLWFNPSGRLEVHAPATNEMMVPATLLPTTYYVSETSSEPSLSLMHRLTVHPDTIVFGTADHQQMPLYVHDSPVCVLDAVSGIHIADPLKGLHTSHILPVHSSSLSVNRLSVTYTADDTVHMSDLVAGARRTIHLGGGDGGETIDAVRIARNSDDSSAFAVRFGVDVRVKDMPLIADTVIRTPHITGPLSSSTTTTTTFQPLQLQQGLFVESSGDGTQHTIRRSGGGALTLQQMASDGSENMTLTLGAHSAVLSSNSSNGSVRIAATDIYLDGRLHVEGDGVHLLCETLRSQDASIELGIVEDEDGNALDPPEDTRAGGGIYMLGPTESVRKSIVYATHTTTLAPDAGRWHASHALAVGGESPPHADTLPTDTQIQAASASNDDLLLSRLRSRIHVDTVVPYTHGGAVHIPRVRGVVQSTVLVPLNTLQIPVGGNGEGGGTWSYCHGNAVHTGTPTGRVVWMAPFAAVVEAVCVHVTAATQEEEVDDNMAGLVLDWDLLQLVANSSESGVLHSMVSIAHGAGVTSETAHHVAADSTYLLQHYDVDPAQPVVVAGPFCNRTFATRFLEEEEEEVVVGAAQRMVFGLRFRHTTTTTSSGSLAHVIVDGHVTLRRHVGVLS